MKRTILVIFLLLLTFAIFPASYPGFRVQGRFLYDHLGEKVVLVGVNKMIYWMDMDGVPSYAEIAKTGANCVRIQWLTDGTPAALDKAIYNCRVNRMIPMVELHDATGDWAKLTSLVDYWVRPDIVAIIQKHSQYLLVNIGNEVGQTVTNADYQSGYQTAVSRMRTAGIHVPLVIDAAGYGKDIDIMQATGPALIAADPDQNLLFSIHMWWPYMWGYTDQQVIDEIAQSVAMNLPLIVGEFGGMWEETETGQIPYKLIIDQCTANQVGWLPWEWGPGNDPQIFLNMTDDSTYATLKGWGLEAAVTYKNSIKNTAKRPASLINITPIPTPSPTPYPPNLISIGKTVVASSVEPDSTNSAAMAADGDLATRWSSDYADPSSIYLDLGKTYSIYKVVVQWETAYGKEYKIQISDNAATWTDIFHVTAGDGGVDELLVSASARYVRMYGIQRANTTWGYSLWEFEVYGVNPGTPVPTPPGGYTGFKVQYKCGETGATASQLKPLITIVNGSSMAVSLSSIKLRYYYTKEGTESETFQIDYAAIGGANITGTFYTGYVEIGFLAAAGGLSPGQNTGEIQVRINKPSFSAYDQSNDYSFTPTQTTAADYTKIPMFYNGELIWGVYPNAPSVTPTRTPTPTAVGRTATLTPTVRKGDVNGSGGVDIVDALMIAQYSVGLSPAGFNAAAADVNCSGVIDIVDALITAQFYVGLLASFPC